jgi:hypothetical protein
MAGGRGRAFVGGVAVGLVCAGGAALVAWREPAAEDGAADVRPVATYSRPEEAAAVPAPPDSAEAAAAEPVTPSVGEEAPVPRPPSAERYTADYPVFEKLVSKPLSREPHQLLGAWDEDENSSQPGERRAFVLAVSPNQSDASLEALARDIRERNLDARVLDVRIYDDAGAAIGPRMLDAGQNSRRHLVAQIQRNPAASLDTILVRGRALDP